MSGRLTNMIEVEIELTFVESLVSETSTYTGTVLLCEYETRCRLTLKMVCCEGVRYLCAEPFNMRGRN